MSQRLSGLNPLAYVGVEPLSPPLFLVKDKAPTSNDSNFNLGTLWLYTTTNAVYILVSRTAGIAVWTEITSGGGASIDFVTGAGTAAPSGGVLSVPDGTNMSTTGAGNVLTVNLNDSVTLAGSLTTGTTATIGTGLTVLAGGITAAGTITFSDLNEGVVFSNGSGELSSVDGTDGQLIIGSTAGTADWATLTAGAGISIVNGSNAITIAATGATASSFPTDSGTATPAAGVLNVFGGANIATSAPGASNTVQVDVSGTTDHTVQIGNASGSLTSLAAAADGELIIGATGGDPQVTTLTAGANISIVNAAGSITISATDTAGTTQFDADVGSATPAAGVITMAGGNNIATSAAGSTVTYNVSGTTTDALQIGNVSGSLTSLPNATNGQLPIGATGTAPSMNTLTAGSGISIVNAPGSITISSSGGTSVGSGFFAYATGNSSNQPVVVWDPRSPYNLPIGVLFNDGSIYSTGTGEVNITGSGQRWLFDVLLRVEPGGTWGSHAGGFYIELQQSFGATNRSWRVDSLPNLGFGTNPITLQLHTIVSMGSGTNNFTLRAFDYSTVAIHINTLTGAFPFDCYWSAYRLS